MAVYVSIISANVRLTVVLLATACLGAADFSAAKSNDNPFTTTVADAFLEMRTGPGRGYPVFHVVEEGDLIAIDKRRTDWFRITTTDRVTKSGWVHVSQMVRTVDTNGIAVTFPGNDLSDAADRRWEWSMSGGDLQGASTISSSVTYRFTRNIALQVQASQILGEVSDGIMIVASIQHSPFPHWRLSPYLQLGTGVLHTEPFSTIVQTEDRTTQTVNAGAGANFYVARRFLVFLDYRYHNVLTSRNENEEISEWKLGFSVFF
jgi:opacity protein-like surface antigen